MVVGQERGTVRYDRRCGVDGVRRFQSGRGAKLGGLEENAPIDREQFDVRGFQEDVGVGYEPRIGLA